MNWRQARGVGVQRLMTFDRGSFEVQLECLDQVVPGVHPGVAALLSAALHHNLEVMSASPLIVGVVFDCL